MTNIGSAVEKNRNSRRKLGIVVHTFYLWAYYVYTNMCTTYVPATHKSQKRMS